MSRLPPPVALPPERVVPVARQTAAFARIIASILAFALGMSLLVLVFEGVSLGMVAWFLILAPATIRFASHARRAGAVVYLASDAVAHSFALHGSYITVHAPDGSPLPHLAFPISGRRCKELLEIPRATLLP